MLTDQKRFNRELSARGAAQRARIVAAASATAYTVVLFKTGGTVTATNGVKGAALVAGQVVLVAPLDPTVPNGGYVITGATGSVQTVAAPVTASKTGEVVTRIDFNPTTLAKGGAAGSVIIYGVGLVTPPTYGDAGITDNVAQVITSTRITLAPKASGGMAIGRYSLTVAGLTIPNFFVVTA